jgi:hypothetical protein
LLTALEEFDHLFVSVQDQVDTESPMGRAMCTIIGAMAELESLVAPGIWGLSIRQSRHLYGLPIGDQRCRRCSFIFERPMLNVGTDSDLV